jgi:alkylhydroperoxidase/carboxymuconolactone decarboxylase family protein YurZ
MSEADGTRPLSRAEEDLKARYVASRGYWSARMERLMRSDPRYFAAYTALSGVPLQRQSLPPKYAELIFVGINLVVPHLYGDGARLHIRKALEEGATPEEVLEVMQIASLVGVHSMHLGLDILEELGRLPDAAGDDDAQQ